jgi:hypothetical protein
MKPALIAALALLPRAALAQEPLNLALDCAGIRAEMVQHTTSGTVRNPYDYTQAAEVQAEGWAVERHDARLTIVLQGDAGKLRPDWGPTFGKKGVDGWYVIDGLAVRDDMISGQVAMGVISKPKLKIDRTTGDVHFGDFKGVCEKSKVVPGERKF